jgi:hypothetical protein
MAFPARKKTPDFSAGASRPRSTGGDLLDARPQLAAGKTGLPRGLFSKQRGLRSSPAWSAYRGGVPGRKLCPPTEHGARA